MPWGSPLPPISPRRQSHDAWGNPLPQQAPQEEPETLTFGPSRQREIEGLESILFAPQPPAQSVLAGLGQVGAQGLRAWRLSQLEDEEAARQAQLGQQQDEFLAMILDPEGGGLGGALREDPSIARSEGFGTMVDLYNILNPDAEDPREGIVINGRLVDPVTGVEIADYSDPQDDRVQPIVVNGQLVDPTTGTVLGDYRDPQDTGAEVDPVVINGQLVDPTTGVVIGDYRDPADAEPDAVRGVVVGGQIVNPVDGTVIYEGAPPEAEDQEVLIVNDQVVDPNTFEVLVDLRDPQRVQTENILIPGEEVPQGFVIGSPEHQAAIDAGGAVVGLDVQAANVGDLNVTTATQGSMEQQLLAAEDTLQQLNTMAETVAAENTTWPQQMYTGVLGFLDNLDPRLIGPESREQLQQQAVARQNTLVYMNEVLSTLAGSAVSASELSRIREGLPTLEDSPSEFQAKLQNSIGLTRATVQRIQDSLGGTPLGEGDVTGVQSPVLPANQQPGVEGGAVSQVMDFLSMSADQLRGLSQDQVYEVTENEMLEITSAKLEAYLEALDRSSAGGGV